MRRRRFIYLAGLFVGAHTALPLYVTSGFLSGIVSPRFVGLFYSLSYLLGILTLAATPTLLNRLGAKKWHWLTLAAAGFALLPLATPAAGWPVALVAAFVLFQIANLILRFNLDLFLEESSDNKHVGAIRGFFLTSSNLGWVIAPVAAGFLVQSTGYWSVYLVTLLLLLPIALVSFRHKTSGFSQNRRRPNLLWTTAVSLWRAVDGRSGALRKILAIDFLLHFFYAIMVIYSPLYLRQIGMEWQQIGLVFSIMLLPFLFLQWPLGFVADRWLGEKEILTIGLIIVGAATISIPFITSAAVMVWAGLLFLTRVGAASVEIMKEAYLFKQIGPKDTAILGLSRIAFPLAYLLAAPLASLFLVFLPIKFIFLPLGILMLAGLTISLRLKDTL